MQIFTQSRWTGNVRELENQIIRGIMFSPGEEIQPADVGFSTGSNRPVCFPDNSNLSYRDAKEEFLRRFHNDYIGRILAKTGGNVSQAAKLCGLERQALQQIMRRYEMKSEDFREKD